MILASHQYVGCSRLSRSLSQVTHERYAQPFAAPALPQPPAAASARGCAEALGRGGTDAKGDYSFIKTGAPLGREPADCQGGWQQPSTGLHRGHARVEA